MSVCVIFNPAAKGDKARKFRAELDVHAGECAFKPTTGPGGARPLATEAVNEGFTTIVAAGGDGTVNEVVNGIADAPEGFARARFGVVPLGTVNVFAKEFEIPTKLRAAWATISQGRERLIDAPFAEFTVEGKIQRRYFAQMAGAGLDARAIAATDWELKKKFGPAAYIIAGIKAMRGPQPLVTASNGTHTASGELVLLGNGRFYGGKLPVFPDADAADGFLEVCVIPRVGFGTLLRWGWGMLTRSSPHARDVVCFKAAEVALTSTVPMPFELEGDNAGHLPARFGIRPKTLRIIVP